MFLCAFGMFFVSSPQQLLMVKVGRGGGEMIGSACVQVAFNLGNAFGATIGQAVLNAGASYASPSLAGGPFPLAAGRLVPRVRRLRPSRCSRGSPPATSAATAQPARRTASTCTTPRKRRRARSPLFA